MSQPPSFPRPWYHRPEWIAAVVTVLVAIIGSVGALSQGQAEIIQNTKDIETLKQQSASVPERLARIEQKVDDLKTIEVTRHLRPTE